MKNFKTPFAEASSRNIAKRFGYSGVSLIATIFAFVFLLHADSKAYMNWNHACSFAGNSSSYISAANSSLLNITGSFALEAWINQSASSTSAKGIIAKGGSLGTTLRYALRLTNKRIFLLINGATRLVSKTSTSIEPNTWYHVCSVFNSSTGEHSLYINGVLDSSSTYSSTLPNSNLDSLYIGISGNSSPFNGMLDEVRIWNRALTSSEAGANFRSVLATSSGIYNGLVFSLPFQRLHSSSPFSIVDHSSGAHPVIGRNISALPFTYHPSNTISTNMAATFDGTEDYLAAKDTSTIEPTNSMTLDLWVYSKDVRSCNLITKGNQYALKLNANTVSLTINGITSVSGITLPLNRWCRLTVTSSPNSARYFLDGYLVTGVNVVYGAIPAGTDSLYIGGVPGATADFFGMLDEVRIQNRLFISEDSVYVNTYKALDLELDLTSNTEVCYNLDGYLKDNEANGGPELHFRNNAGFSNPGTAADVEVSPLFRSYDVSLQEGFYLPPFNNLNQFIPPTGTTGTTTVQIPIHFASPITSLEVMIGLNHQRLADLSIDLIAPNGDSARLMTSVSPIGNDNSARIIFTDVADSTIGSGKYSSVAGLIKPQSSFAVFNGDNPQGFWFIKIKDNVSGNRGMAHVCGIRINQQIATESNFTLNTYIEGHYNSNTNNQIGDTLKVILRNFSNPSIIYDTAKAFMSYIGNTKLSFSNVPYDARCFIQVNHRNSIETWNAFQVVFKKFASSYNLYLDPVAAFGNNLVHVDFSPETYAIYSGDVNQDRTVDATDVSLIDNDAANFAAGYIATDLTGDNFVDGTDFAIADNNAANFVSAILP
jgi:subtilisin-like proprotein convertase family protein